MRKLTLTVFLLFASPAPALSQSVDDQLKQQQLEAARLANEKARIALVDPLRTITPPDAKIATPEKAAEAQMLRIKLYQGLASRLVDRLRLPGGVEPSKFSPILVMGSTPPTAAHWAAFDAQRSKLSGDMAHALERWRTVYASYCLDHSGCSGKKTLAAVGLAIEAVTTVYSLFKTDLSIAGANIQAPAGDLESYVIAAMKARGYAVDLSRYETANGKADADGLLSTIKPKYDEIRKAYTEQYLPIVVGAEGGKPEKIGDDNVAAQGQVLNALVDAYEALEKSLYLETGGVLAATTIERERLISTDRSTTPVLFVTGQDAALTTTTRKGVFVKSAKATTLTAIATANFAVVDGKPISTNVGTVSCVIRDRQPSDMLGYDPASDPRSWGANCDSGAAQATRGTDVMETGGSPRKNKSQ